MELMSTALLVLAIIAAVIIFAVVVLIWTLYEEAKDWRFKEN